MDDPNRLRLLCETLRAGVNDFFNGRSSKISLSQAIHTHFPEISQPEIERISRLIFDGCIKAFVNSADPVLAASAAGATAWGFYRGGFVGLPALAAGIFLEHFASEYQTSSKVELLLLGTGAVGGIAVAFSLACPPAAIGLLAYGGLMGSFCYRRRANGGLLGPRPGKARDGHGRGGPASAEEVPPGVLTDLRAWWNGLTPNEREVIFNTSFAFISTVLTAEGVVTNAPLIV